MSAPLDGVGRLLHEVERLVSLAEDSPFYTMTGRHTGWIVSRELLDDVKSATLAADALLARPPLAPLLAVAEAAREAVALLDSLVVAIDWEGPEYEVPVHRTADALLAALAALEEPLPFTHPRLGVASVREEFDPHILEEPLP